MGVKLRGQEEQELRIAFYNQIDEIKIILSDSYPIDKIIDIKTREILRKIRDGYYFVYDEEHKNFMSAVKRLEAAGLLEDFLKKRGIEATDEEVDLAMEKEKSEFYSDIDDKLDIHEYFTRKSLFGTIINGKRLPQAFHSYFSEIKDCFLFGQMKAAVGLCRVIIELAFRDRFRHMGLAHRYRKQNVYEMDNFKIKNIMRLVCNELNIKFLFEDACKVYHVASKILHGETQLTDENEEFVANFVRDTFVVIEKLYN